MKLQVISLDREVVVGHLARGDRVATGLRDRGDVDVRVVEGIERGDFYIVTHPPVRDVVVERTAEILAAFDEQAPRFDGDEYLDTRTIVRGRSR